MEALCVGPLSAHNRPVAMQALGLQETARIRFLGGLQDPAELPGMVARCGNELLGVTLYAVHDKRLRFLRTAVANQSPAVLRALLSCAERQALHQGCQTAQLYLTQPGPEAVRSYQELGYRVVALYPACVAGHLGAEHGQDVVELEKSLRRAPQFSF